MGYADPFLLGPVGRLLPLPSNVAKGFSAPYQRSQAVQTSLRGGTTVYVFGAKRSWEFEFAFRHGLDVDRLIARWTSPIFTEKLRLIDPITPNRLSLDAASGGGTTGLVDAATVDAGTVERITPAVMPAEVDGLLDGAYRWTPSTGAGALLLDDIDRVPVQVGETLTFTAWARGTASVEPFVRRLLSDGSTSDSASPAVALQEMAWTEVTETVTVQAGTVAMAPGIKVAAAPGVREVELTAAVFTADPNAPGYWTPGGGAPVVTLTAFDHGYQQTGLREMELVVKEV